MRICSACGHAMTPDGPCGFASITVGEKTTYLCHADDHSCSSPGADPRLRALVSYWDGIYGDTDADWSAMDVLAAVDAADEAAGIVRVDTRDEAVVERVMEILLDHGTRYAARAARAVLAALAGEQ